MFTKFTKIVNGSENQGKIYTNAEKVNKLRRALPNEWSYEKTSICEMMRIQPITMDESIGTLISYEAEHLNKENNSKGQKAIAFKANLNNAGEQTSSEDEDDEDMTLLTKRFKNFLRKGGNFKGKRQMRFSKDKRPFKSKEESKGKLIVCY